MKPSRLEAFSDGVFAVAITLLVFNLKVPEIGSGHLSKSLGHQWPSYLAYVISFLSIGICWVNHHSIMDRVAMADRELLFINLAVLLGIVSIPFSTSLAALWYNQGSDAKWAIGIYCANWVYVSATYIIVIRHLLSHEHLSSHATGVTLTSLLRKGNIGIVAYLIATLVSLFYPIVAFFICLALATYYVFGVQAEESSEHLGH
jgi:uncharacterized membrane protein